MTETLTRITPATVIEAVARAHGILAGLDRVMPDPNVSVRAYDWCEPRIEFSWHLSGGEDQKPLARQIVRALGGKWDKRTWDGTYLLNQKPDRGLEYIIYLDRDEVCERVVVGQTEKIMPAVEAQPERVELVDEVEWRCGSILSEDDVAEVLA